MCGGFLKTTSRFALVAATGLFLSQIGEAQAADLGGDCCADLEERVAELEATTVRKGVRQLSMTISGRIHTAVMYWDDGGSDQDASEADPANGGGQFPDARGTDPNRSSDLFVGNGWGAASRVSIDGRAQINSDWDALYRFSMEYNGSGFGSSATNGPNQFGTRASQDDTINAQEVYVGVRSKTLGALTIGRRGAVHSGAAKVDVTGKLGIVNNVDPNAYGSNLHFRMTNNELTLATAGAHFTASDGDGGYTERDNVRYDSPVFAGFVLSADWGQQTDATGTDDEDYWSIRLSYANQFADFRVVGAAAYWDENNVGPETVVAGQTFGERSGWLGSAGVMHVPTGLFLNGGGGQIDVDAVTGECWSGGVGGAAVNCDDPYFWYVTGGISGKWTSLGATTIFGTYYHSDNNNTGGDGLDNLGVDLADDNFESKYWGIGIAQDIDAASMRLFLNYRRLETDARWIDNTNVDGGVGAATCAGAGDECSVDDIHIFGVGGIINF